MLISSLSILIQRMSKQVNVSSTYKKQYHSYSPCTSETPRYIQIVAYKRYKKSLNVNRTRGHEIGKVAGDRQVCKLFGECYPSDLSNGKSKFTAAVKFGNKFNLVAMKMFFKFLNSMGRA